MSREQYVRTLLGPADPARGAAVPPARSSAADLIMRADGGRQAADGAAGVVTTAARPSRRLVLSAAAVTVAAGATSAVYPFIRHKAGGSGATPGPGTASRQTIVESGTVVVPLAYEVATNPPPARAHLRALAGRLTDAQYDIHNGQYVYHHSKWWGGAQTQTPEGYVMSYVEDFQRWTARDGSVRQRHTMLPPEFPDEASRRYWESNPPTPDPSKSQPPRSAVLETLPSGPDSPGEPLPTNQARLAERLDVRYGPGAAAKMVGAVYERYGIPRQTRAAILEVLADAPRFFWRGEVTDRGGRTGVAITGEDRGQQAVLVFDPKTGVLLAYEMVFLEPEQRLGAYQLLMMMDRTDRVG